MAFGQTPRDAGGIPVSSAYVPNVGWVALQGSPVNNTDGSSNTSAGIVSVDQIQSAIMNGKGYAATTGALATATNGNLTVGVSVFNPAASGKSLYIFSMKFHAFANNAAPKYNTGATTDPAYANVLTPQNLRSGGPASVASVTSPANNATTSIALSGSLQDFVVVNTTATFELLTAPAGIMLPAGTASGIILYGIVVAAGGTWGATIRWIEF